MTPYANRSGDSGVKSYAFEPQAITVTFASGDTYRYTYASAGRENVEYMKTLARAGQGLATFISQQVGANYERKLP